MKTLIAVLALLLSAAIPAKAQTLPETTQWIGSFTRAHSYWKAGEKLFRSELHIQGCRADEILFDAKNLQDKGTHITFSLSALDPNSVRAYSDSDAFPYVKFETTNNKAAISFVTSPPTLDSWNINFDEPENAKRFAKAFRRAVKLCGGKPSIF